MVSVVEGIRGNVDIHAISDPHDLADVELASMTAHPRFHEHMQRLDRFIAMAHLFEAPNIRTFGFTRDVGGANPSPRAADGGGMPVTVSNRKGLP